MIKCIGCYSLLRLELDVKDKHPVVYNCHHYFPYACVISGLLRPGKGILDAVKDCPERIDAHCILCSQPAVVEYGEPPIAFACKRHHQTWGEWLDKHPERQSHLRPRGRRIRANWIEVFREFIEDMRSEVEGTAIKT